MSSKIGNFSFGTGKRGPMIVNVTCQEDRAVWAQREDRPKRYERPGKEAAIPGRLAEGFEKVPQGQARLRRLCLSPGVRARGVRAACGCRKAKKGESVRG